MSSNKRLCLRSNALIFKTRINSIKTLKRQSFSERICDDLCEEILQYIELEDKLRLQCVSKQFQRTVFQKQFVLKIDDFLIQEIEIFSIRNHCFDFLTLEILLKKCPNITSIELTDNLRFFSTNDYKKFNDLIIKNCNKLVEFKCAFNNVSEVDFKKFYKRFSSQLKVLKYTENGRNHLEHNFFPLLQSLELYSPQGRLVKTLSRLNCTKYKELSLCYDNDEEMLSMQMFDNCKNLRHLNIYHADGTDEGARNLILLYNISKLKDLIHLKVEPLIRLDEEIYFKAFKQIANNCRNLKRIECSFVMNWRKGSQWRRLMSLLKEFKQLKRLELDITNLNDIEDEVEEVNQEGFSFQLFDGLPSLTHLSLQFPHDEYMSETVLKNIGNYLLNLQNFEMTATIKISPGATIVVAHRLCQLLKLETINLRVDTKVSQRRLIQALVTRCKKLRNISIEW